MKSPSSGFTLVEFLVASLATMALLAATFTLMGMVFAANAEIVEITETQQNVRVAMNTITRDIIMAGTGLPNGGIAVPNGMDSEGLARPGIGGTLSTPSNAIAILAPGNEAGPTIGGIDTDAITIVAIDQLSPTWNVAAINVAGTEVDFTVDVTMGSMTLVPGDLLVFTNTNGSVFGFITALDEMDEMKVLFDDMDAMNINQPLAEFGNIQTLANMDGTYPPTTATRVNIISYYISDAVADHPRLIRAVNAQVPQVIVEDIENIQFKYDLFDFDTDDSTAEEDTTNSPNQIRSVYVSITGRSPQIMQASQRYYRFPLVSKVNVRNATFRNRYTGT
jgi:hypothetical protein